MKSSSGKKAEQAAANYLEIRGFTILECNWRTPWCEIDIVARKNDIIYFVEVKYRLTSDFGEGFDFIGERKLKQMARAAESWLQQQKWDHDYQLAAIELGGKDYSILQFIDDV